MELNRQTKVAKRRHGVAPDFSPGVLAPGTFNIAKRRQAGFAVRLSSLRDLHVNSSRYPGLKPGATTCRRSATLLIVSWLCFANAALVVGQIAQQPGDSVPAQNASNVVRPNGAGLADLLEMSQQLNQLDAGMDAAKARLLDERENLLSDKRLDSIHERIFLIRNLIDQKRSDQRLDEIANQLQGQQNPDSIIRPFEQSPASIPLTDATTRPADSTLPKSTDEMTSQPPTAATSLAAEPSMAVTSAAKTQPESGNDSAAKNAQPVVTRPVDSMELATSLFMTGNVAAARATCEERLKSDATADADLAVWLRCLIGCCYRLEGNYDEAEMMFREVTNGKQLTFPSDYSRWSLGYLKQRREMNDRFEQIATEIDSLVAEKVQDE